MTILLPARGSGRNNYPHHHRHHDLAVAFTLGGRAIHRRRPDLSSSVCNAVADLAAIGPRGER